MLKALQDISATKKRIEIEIPAEAIESEIKKGLIDIQKRAKLPGFRPGKVPMSFIEKKFGKDVESDVLEKIIPDFYQEAIKDADIMPVTKPVIEKSPDFKRNAPLSMTITVEVRPKVENLNYEGITINDVHVEVKDDEIDTILKNLAEEKATYVPSDDAIDSGDLVTANYTIKEDGTVAKDVVLKVGSSRYPQELFDGIVGRKRDEVFEIEVSFPKDSQFPFADKFDGKVLKLEVKIKDVKKRDVPAIDDEFAKDLGAKNLESLKDKLRSSILASKNKEADRTKQMTIMDKLIESHSFEVPESLLSAEFNGIIAEIKASGKDKQPDESLLKEIKPHAEKRVRATILLGLIGEKEGINVSEDDMKEEIINISQKYHISPDNVMKHYTERDGSLWELKRSIFETKVLSLLLSKAQIEKKVG